ncbi:unnamed protein product [Effrenium voratum]|nr:unnamed protein product [Effrenium voratum]
MRGRQLPLSSAREPLDMDRSTLLQRLICLGDANVEIVEQSNHYCSYSSMAAYQLVSSCKRRRWIFDPCQQSWSAECSIMCYPNLIYHSPDRTRSASWACARS